MTVQQLAIFVENKPGCLREITRVLAQGNVDILGFCLADTARFGVLRMIVNDTQRANEALAAANIKASISSVVAARIPDHPGALDGLLALLADGGMSVEYAYSHISRIDGAAVALLCLDDNTAGAALLLENGVELLSDEQIRMA